MKWCCQSSPLLSCPSPVSSHSKHPFKQAHRTLQQSQSMKAALGSCFLCQELPQLSRRWLFSGKHTQVSTTACRKLRQTLGGTAHHHSHVSAAPWPMMADSQRHNVTNLETSTQGLHIYIYLYIYVQSHHYIHI